MQFFKSWQNQMYELKKIIWRPTLVRIAVQLNLFMNIEHMYLFEV